MYGCVIVSRECATSSIKLPQEMNPVSVWRRHDQNSTQETYFECVLGARPCVGCCEWHKLVLVNPAVQENGVLDQPFPRVSLGEGSVWCSRDFGWTPCFPREVRRWSTCQGWPDFLRGSLGVCTGPEAGECDYWKTLRQLRMLDQEYEGP